MMTQKSVPFSWMSGCSFVHCSPCTGITNNTWKQTVRILAHPV